MKAFIFDLDGVVADTAAAHTRSWARLAEEEGVPFDARVAKSLLGRTREDSLALFAQGFALDAAEAGNWLARKQRHFIEELARMGPGDALPGVVLLLEATRDRGIATALASSSRNARAVLDQLRIGNLFDFIADGAAVARPKPAPDIFLHVADAVGAPPGQCVVFEDSDAGINAALAGGFPVVALGNAHPGATWNLSSLLDVRPDDFLAQHGTLAHATG